MIICTSHACVRASRSMHFFTSTKQQSSTAQHIYLQQGLWSVIGGFRTLFSIFPEGQLSCQFGYRKDIQRHASYRTGEDEFAITHSHLHIEKQQTWR